MAGDGDRLADRAGGAGRGVALAAVVHFEDFGVVIGFGQGGGEAGGEVGDEHDAGGEVGGLHDGDEAGGVVDGGLRGVVEAGGAEDPGGAGGGQGTGVPAGGGGVGEVDHGVGGVREGQEGGFVIVAADAAGERVAALGDEGGEEGSDAPADAGDGYSQASHSLAGRPVPTG